jgi:hypothetical protein
MKSHLVYIPAFLLSVIFLYCKDTVTNSDIDNVTIPSSNVSYIKYIQPLFNVKCNYSGCHDDESRAAGVSLTNYQSATSDLSIIFPGEPQNSRLAIAIQPGAAYPMPPAGYPSLTKNQIDGIITWIKEGAKNN